jgi:glyoxylase-like metal-dependent hydrolase (beta-lactamase superfamily II)
VSEEVRIIDLGFVNAYLIKTRDGDILVDTGVAQQWSRLETELLQTKSLPTCLKLVIITHGDFDHTGNCAELQRKYHVKIAMHVGDIDIVKTGIPAKRQGKGVLGKIFLWLGQRMRGNFQRFEPDILLEDGQGLEAYGWDVRVICTPGHTKGSIAILTANGELFAGDTISNRSKPNGAQFIENREELRASLAILKGLKARIVYPGHGKPFAFEALASIVG